MKALQFLSEDSVVMEFMETRLQKSDVEEGAKVILHQKYPRDDRLSFEVKVLKIGGISRLLGML